MCLPSYRQCDDEFARLDSPLRADVRYRDRHPLPALWHRLYFVLAHRQSESDPDGHAQSGCFLPPVPPPRGMRVSPQRQPQHLNTCN